MAIIDPNEIGLFFTIRGKLHKPLDVNPLKPNSRVNAFPLLLPGVYQVFRHGGKLTNWRRDFWVEPPPNSASQIAWQGVYRAGVAEWNALTAEQKKVWIKKAYGKHMNGYNVFMKRYLETHTP